MTVYTLGIDAGGSSTRWALQMDDERIASGRLQPLSGPPLDPHTEAQAVELLTSIAERARRAIDKRSDPQAQVAAAAGIAGLPAGSTFAGQLETYFANTLRVDRTFVQVVTDIHIAYRAAFAPDEGILVQAGTGSFACHVTGTGELLRVGGHGYLLDDGGSGFWIGREALRTVLRGADEKGTFEGELASRILAELGGSSWSELSRTIYGGGRQRIASLVPMVVSAAEAGDPNARLILHEAGRELARLARILMQRLDAQLPVRLAGGIIGAGELLTEAVREELPEDVPLTVRTLSPLRGALHLAADLLQPSGPAEF